MHYHEPPQEVRQRSSHSHPTQPNTSGGDTPRGRLTHQPSTDYSESKEDEEDSTPKLKFVIAPKSEPVSSQSSNVPTAPPMRNRSSSRSSKSLSSDGESSHPSNSTGLRSAEPTIIEGDPSDSDSELLSSPGVTESPRPKTSQRPTSAHFSDVTISIENENLPDTPQPSPNQAPSRPLTSILKSSSIKRGWKEHPEEPTGATLFKIVSKDDENRVKRSLSDISTEDEKIHRF